MKKTWALLASFLILLVPMAAHANIWIPSFVQCVASPLTSSLAIVTLIITIPVTLIVSGLEAFVISKCVKGIRSSKIVADLTIINAITSIFGALLMPMGTELWPGLLICFLLTVASEGVLLFAFAEKMQLPRSFRQAFSLSAKMNTISYALLAATLVALVYLPQIGNETYRLKKEARGKLAIVNFTDDFQILDFSAARPNVSKKQSLELTTVNQYVQGSNGKIFGLADRQIVEATYAAGYWRKTVVDLPSRASNPVGISPDGRLVCCSIAERPVIYDVISKRIVRDLRQHAKEADFAAFSYDRRWVAVGCSYDVRVNGEKVSQSEWQLIDLNTGAGVPLAEAWDAVFNPTSNLLAWETDNTIVIRDCKAGTERALRVPGSISSGIAWSPDGRFIAYMGHPNPFTAQNWTPDVRAVDAQTGESATLYENVFTSGAPSDLFWLK